MNNTSGRLEKETQFYEKIKNKLEGMPKIINEYYISMRANRKSYNTIDAYINNVLHFTRFVTNGNLTDEFYKNITSSDIENYMISLETIETQNGIKRTGDSVLQFRWSSLNTFFEWCMKRGYIDSNPIKAVDRPKNNTEHKVNYLTKTEINKLLKAVDNNPNKVIAMRDKTIISLALATGLRVSALVNINVEDIDFEDGIVKVIEKRQKVREIALGDNIKKILSDWIRIRNIKYEDVDSSALFISQKNNRLSTDSANDMLERYCSAAGIKRITFHKLRSTAACTLAKAGLPLKSIQKQLGHSNSSTTLIYIDAFKDDDEKAKSILDNIL